MRILGFLGNPLGLPPLFPYVFVCGNHHSMTWGSGNTMAGLRLCVPGRGDPGGGGARAGTCRRPSGLRESLVH